MRFLINYLKLYIDVTEIDDKFSVSENSLSPLPNFFFGSMYSSEFHSSYAFYAFMYILLIIFHAHLNAHSSYLTLRFLLIHQGSYLFHRTTSALHILNSEH